MGIEGRPGDTMSETVLDCSGARWGEQRWGKRSYRPTRNRRCTVHDITNQEEVRKIKSAAAEVPVSCSGMIYRRERTIRAIFTV